LLSRADKGRRVDHVFVFVWAGIGAFVAILLAIAWWYDRDARKRGASPRSGAEMGRERRRQEAEIAREMSQVNTKAITPKGQDAMRDAWRGNNGQG
jgi:hypothetical protein